LHPHRDPDRFTTKSNQLLLVLGLHGTPHRPPS